ncbi:MAG: M24 family metallopeptidase [Streptosporangiales bacterium]|nr:M24 family metallopeptidase [Streptosporangiales bacterium]
MGGSGANHAVRRDRLRVLLAQRDVEAAIVTRLVNVRYLSGFSGSNGALVVRENGADLLVTDGRYADQAVTEAPDLELYVDYPARTGVRLPVAVHAAKQLVASGERRVAFEDHDVTVAAHRAMVDGAAELGLGSLQRGVEQLRMVKDEVEIAALRRACTISDQALTDLLPGIREGITERDLARKLDAKMREHGADAPGFPTIVASGPNSAIPHHQPTDRLLQTGDFVKIDFGARYAGYHADETRTFVVGVAAGWQKEIYELVVAAQHAAKQALVPGVAAKDVDAASRAVITDAGFGDRFTHGLGHGVGLEIHEDPFMGYSSTATLASRVPVTVEPGVYLPGRGGVRVEDTVLVDAEGTESLTRTDRELTVLG